MKQVFTQKCLRVVALMVLMLASSMVANAKYYLRGDYTSDGPGWSSDDKEMIIHYMDEGQTVIDYIYIDITVEPGFQFKIADSSGNWYGCSDSERIILSIPWSFDFLMNDGNNLEFNVAGTYRVIFADSNLGGSRVTCVPCPVEVAQDLAGGSVTVDKPEATAGDTVTVTVTPDYGYAANASDIDIELTANPGIFQAPSRKSNAPQIGDIFHPSGETMATHDAPATYTFVMPDYPYGVYISANFQTLRTHRIGFATGYSYSLSHDQENPAAVPVGTNVTITAHLQEDLFVMQMLSLPTIPITDNGDGTYSFTMPDFDVDFYAEIGSKLHGVTFGDNKNWATYYGNFDLVLPENVTAYVVDEVVNNEVQITEVPIIPEKAGVLLYSEVPMENITTRVNPYYQSYTSLLQGSAEDMEISSGYGLYNDMFVRSQAGTLPAHRCYLPASAVPTGAPRMLKINRPGEGGVVTGVETISTNDVVNVKYVNMSGMTSDKPFDGVNVKVVTRSNGTIQTSKVIK